MPIGDKMLLEIWIAHLERHGVGNVLINTSHLADQVVGFVDGIRDRYNIRIDLFHETRLLGSGGTLWANRSWVDGEEDFLICYADNLTNLDLGDMVRAHKEFRAGGAILTMGLIQAPDPRACGVAVLDDTGKIVEFVEKPENPRSDLANAGVYVATCELFDHFPSPRFAPRDIVDLGYHVLPNLTGRMFGYRIREYLKDIGTVEAYHTALDQWKKRE